MKHKINLLVYSLLLWQLLAVGIDREVIVPYPLDVIKKMGQMIWDISFYQTIFTTLSHVVVVVMGSMVVAFILAYICYRYPIVDEYVTPVLSFIQAIPNISFIILVLVWTTSIMTVYIVLFFVIFPLLYHNFIHGFKNIPADLVDVIWLYHPPFFDKMLHVYMPLLKPSLLSGMKSALSLGVKVAVMAEILAGLPYGVGRAINFARIQFDMESVFAWTIWLVMMIIVIEYILKRLIHE